MAGKFNKFGTDGFYDRKKAKKDTPKPKTIDQLREKLKKIKKKK